MASRGKSRAGKGDDWEQSLADRKGAQEIGQLVHSLEKDLDQLRAIYEMYFMGIERIEPIRQRDLLKKRFRQLETRQFKNTGIKFLSLIHI